MCCMASLCPPGVPFYFPQRPPANPDVQLLFPDAGDLSLSAEEVEFIGLDITTDSGGLGAPIAASNNSGPSLSPWPGDTGGRDPSRTTAHDGAAGRILAPAEGYSYHHGFAFEDAAALGLGAMASVHGVPEHNYDDDNSSFDQSRIASSAVAAAAVEGAISFQGPQASTLVGHDLGLDTGVQMLVPAQPAVPWVTEPSLLSAGTDGTSSGASVSASTQGSSLVGSPISQPHAHALSPLELLPQHQQQQIFQQPEVIQLEPRRPSTSSPSHDSDSQSTQDLLALSAIPASALDRPLVPTSSADWEAKKDLIEDLYMNQNLILNEVIEVMQTRHRFKATARMYKGQFAKWRWSKYNKPGKADAARPSRPRLVRRRGIATTTTTAAASSRAALSARRAGLDALAGAMVVMADSPQPATRVAMIHQSEDAFLSEAALSAYATFLENWGAREAPWKTASNFRDGGGGGGRHGPGPPGRLSTNSILQSVGMALGHFGAGRHARGGDVLRQAFLQIETAVGTGFDMEAIWDCCLAVPQLVLRSGWIDILLIFTSHLYRLTSAKLPRHPMARIARCLHRLASGSGGGSGGASGSGSGSGIVGDQGGSRSALSLYLQRAWELWVDMMPRVRGDGDFVTIHVQRGYLMLMADPRTTVAETLLPRFGEQVLGSVAARGEHETTRQILELESLLSRMFIPLFTAEATRRANEVLFRTLAKLEASPQNAGRPVHAWPYLDRYLFFSALHFLAAVADQNGETELAAEYRRRSLRSPKDMFWLQTALRLEETLMDEGRVAEAEEIARERREVPSPEYYEHPDLD